jgi:hypothetical protein
MDQPFCCRCKDDGFEVKPYHGPRMGELYKLGEVPAKWRKVYKDWKDHPEGAHLCGNCIFDLEDGEQP